ncbi:hypothetical protein [Chryseobacterium sp.]|uniref:hypothetical protein n=1 Tax=Chryseobacterium sp. TaxID=1871047 RepID=UPI0025C68A18|nr:hypothetical protein [Chryseobacterium sp.]
MAEDSSKCIKDFWAEIPRTGEDFLGSIRSWKNVQVALEDKVIWLKGFTEEQAASSELLQLPDFLLYELREGLLFRKNALVPTKKMRTALLWTPIGKALKVDFPLSNQNYFGIQDTIEVKLKAIEEEQPAFALLSRIDEIKDHIITLPKFKLDLIDWTILNNCALFLGIPLLSLPGKTYWRKDGHLLPAGFDFEWKNLSLLLQQKYNENMDQWILWNTEGEYVAVSKDNFKKLSVSSFRLSEKAKEWN